VRNITLGFGHVNDPASLEPLIAPYFDAISGIWKDRSYSIAQSFVVGLYPAALASEQLVDATRAWLDANPEVPALRRLVIENLAGVERALKAQHRDAN
jgi:aminopeptidase N